MARPSKSFEDGHGLRQAPAIQQGKDVGRDRDEVRPESSPTFRIDVVAALDVLAASADHPHLDDAMSGKAGVRGLVSHSLATWGLTYEDLFGHPIVPDGTEPRLRPSRFMTIGAVVAFRAADRAERRGATWPQAVRAARRDVCRLLTVVPESVYRSARAGRAE